MLRLVSTPDSHRCLFLDAGLLPELEALELVASALQSGHADADIEPLMSHQS